MLKIDREPFLQIYVDAGRLFNNHWRELSFYQDIPLEIDAGFYQLQEKAGVLHCFSARLDGELVGYLAHFVKHNARYRSSLQASQDVLFVAPEHRTSRIGYRLIQFADATLTQLGAQVVYHHSKLSHDIGPILLRQGYQPIETIWGKRLDACADVITGEEA